MVSIVDSVTDRLCYQFTKVRALRLFRYNILRWNISYMKQLEGMASMKFFRGQWSDVTELAMLCWPNVTEYP
jgi:hypothetical protein